METRQCPICGEEFKPKTKNQVYCSQTCGRKNQNNKVKAAQRAKREAAKAATRPVIMRCAFCKVDFVVEKVNQKYCSGKCRKNRENQRVKEKVAKQKQREDLGQWKYTRTCVICGGEFKTNNKKRQACSTDCIRAYRRLNAEKARHPEETKTEKKTRESREKWAAIEAKCNALGVSYGYAVAMGLID